MSQPLGSEYVAMKSRASPGNEDVAVSATLPTRGGMGAVAAAVVNVESAEAVKFPAASRERTR